MIEPKVTYCGSIRMDTYEGGVYMGQGWMYGVHFLDGDYIGLCPNCKLMLGDAAQSKPEEGKDG